LRASERVDDLINLADHLSPAVMRHGSIALIDEKVSTNPAT
jgi:hypothetical protein